MNSEDGLVAITSNKPEVMLTVLS